MHVDGSPSILSATLNGCVTLEKLTSQKCLLPDIHHQYQFSYCEVYVENMN